MSYDFLLLQLSFIWQHYDFHLDSGLADMTLADDYEDERLIHHGPQLTGKMKLMRVM